MDITIKPASHRRAGKSDQRKGEEVNRAESGEKGAAPQERNYAERRKHYANDQARANGELYEQTHKVQSEEQNERAGNRSQKRAVLAKKRAHGTGRGPERDKHDGEADHERQRRSEKARAGRLPLTQLLHTDAGKHRNVARHERENTG